jgi:hypothetical protein
MQISDEKIEEFIFLYFEEYGRKIDKAQARTELTSLVCLLDAVYKFNNNINYE